MAEGRTATTRMLHRAVRAHWYGESAQGIRLPRGPEARERADKVLRRFFRGRSKALHGSKGRS